jgi:uncharacterized protein YegP (UPF0339 family)
VARVGTRQQMRVELFADTAGAWRWRIRYQNGRIACTSEAYSSKSKARQSAESCRDSMRLTWPEVVEVEG